MSVGAADETKESFELADYLNAALSLLDVTMDPTWMPAVVANMQVLRAAAALICSFELPDEAEAASIFQP